MRVFLDACVLYPPLVRTLVLGAAERGLFVPLWSGRVVEEWRRAVERKQGDAAGLAVEAAGAAMHFAFPDALLQQFPDLEVQITLPDPADAHVLAAAIGGDADVLLTFNLRDFPRRALFDSGLEVRHPDGFLWELLGREEQSMSDATEAALASFDVARDRARAALKRAHLSRFGKAWEARAAS